VATRYQGLHDVSQGAGLSGPKKDLVSEAYEIRAKTGNGDLPLRRILQSLSQLGRSLSVTACKLPKMANGCICGSGNFLAAASARAGEPVAQMVIHRGSPKRRRNLA
jgi:hypothetical protein